MKTCPQCKSTYPTQFTVCPKDATHLEDVTDLSAGTILRGKYKILKKLGEGGMGAVYKAQHLRFEEVCALKMVLPEHLAEPTFLQRFHAEALLMRKLDHPHALRVQDVDETEDGLPFIVMEYLEGESLDAILVRGALPPARAIRIAMQSCEALGAAHRLGIIHRDIKPANLLIMEDPDGCDYVKVLDFGIAKVKAGSPLREGASMTQTGALVGTPAYMSPEQCQGARGAELTGASDLYSLGVVLFQMLTGSVPFKADSTVGVIIAHLQQAPPDLHALHPEISPRLVAVVRRALEKDPAQRYATAEDMHEALAAAASSLDKTTIGPRPVLRPGEGELAPTTRHGTLNAGGAGTGASPASPSQVVTPVAPPSRPPSSAGQPATPPPAAERQTPAPLAAGPTPPQPSPASSAPASPAQPLLEPPVAPARPTPAPPAAEAVKTSGAFATPAAPARRSGMNPVATFVGGVALAAVLLAGIWYALRSQLPGQAQHNDSGDASSSGTGQPPPAETAKKPPAKPPARSGPEESGKAAPPAAALVPMPQFVLHSTLGGHTDAVESLTLTRHGLILASGGADKMVRLWDPAKGRALGPLAGHTGPVFGVAFSPDGQLLASASGDATVRVWELAKGKTIQTLTGHTGAVFSVAFSPDGTALATGGKDATVRLWDVSSGQVLRTFAGHAAAVRVVAFNPDGSVLATAGEDHSVILWDVRTGNQIYLLRGHADQVHGLAFSPDGRTLASSSRDRTVRLWDVQSGNALRTLSGHNGGVEAVAFSLDGRTLASGGEDETVRIWDVSAGRELGKLAGQSGGVRAIIWGRDGKMLVAGGADKNIRVWNTD